MVSGLETYPAQNFPSKKGFYSGNQQKKSLSFPSRFQKNINTPLTPRHDTCEYNVNDLCNDDGTKGRQATKELPVDRLKLLEEDRKYLCV